MLLEVASGELQVNMHRDIFRMAESGQRERYRQASYETRCLNDYGPLMLMKFVKNHLLSSARRGHRQPCSKQEIFSKWRRNVSVFVCVCVCGCAPQSVATPFYPAFVTTFPMRPSNPNTNPSHVHVRAHKQRPVGFPAS